VLKFFIYLIATGISAWLVPGIRVDNAWALLITAAVLALINTFLRPVITFLSFPLVILTGGLFLFVVNALTIMLAGALVDGFVVGSFASALGMALAIFVVWLFAR